MKTNVIFIQYWIFATMEFSEMNLCEIVSLPRSFGEVGGVAHVKILRFTLKGMGTMSSMKSAISKTRRTKT